VQVRKIEGGGIQNVNSLKGIIYHLKTVIKLCKKELEL
jgi:hypothetical protein